MSFQDQILKKWVTHISEDKRDRVRMISMMNKKQENVTFGASLTNNIYCYSPNAKTFLFLNMFNSVQSTHIIQET